MDSHKKGATPNTEPEEAAFGADSSRKEQFSQRRVSYRGDMRSPARYAGRQGFSRQGLVPLYRARRSRAPTKDNTGRGPRGYRPSQERLWEDVCERLSADAYVDATDVAVSIDQETVILEGTVPSRRMKHRAEDLSASAAGVLDVENRLRVVLGTGR